MPALWSAAGLRAAAEAEARRARRTGRGFSVVRCAPSGWAALEQDLAILERTLAAEVRATDVVQVTRTREVGVLLVDATGEGAQVAAARLRTCAALRCPELRVRVGCASVGRGAYDTWQEAWRWAGALLVADAAEPAAA